MTGPADEYGLRDEERLPWLEAAEAEEPEGPGIGRMILLAVLGLVLLGAIGFGIWRMQSGRGGVGGGSGELIAAQEGDYKIRPDDPGGLKVEGEGDSAIAASAGVNQSAAIDLRAVPEAPITGRRGPAPAASATAKPVASATVPAAAAPLRAQKPMTAPSAPVPGSGSGGSLVQLGAFPTEAAANTAWSAIARRFGYVAQLGKSVVKAEVGGRTVYFLRVNAGSAGAAADICGRLKVAGEGCFVTS